jgi:hypothetical protein
LNAAIFVAGSGYDLQSAYPEKRTIFQDQGSSKKNTRPGEVVSNELPSAEPIPKDDGTRYFYEFTQPEFYIRHVQIEHDSTGRGQISFERLNEEQPVVETFQLSKEALARILGFYQELGFLESTTSYQADKQFPHLGTMRLRMEQGQRKREAEFNWTNNRNASGLVNEYRKITDQWVFLFDISVARENQPLNAPKLMETLELLIKRDALSDVMQLVPLLREVSTDEHLPLIARNHAARLLKRIEQKK